MGEWGMLIYLWSGCDSNSTTVSRHLVLKQSKQATSLGLCISYGSGCAASKGWVAGPPRPPRPAFSLPTPCHPGPSSHQNHHGGSVCVSMCGFTAVVSYLLCVLGMTLCRFTFPAMESATYPDSQLNCVPMSPAQRGMCCGKDDGVMQNTVGMSAPPLCTRQVCCPRICQSPTLLMEPDRESSRGSPLPTMSAQNRPHLCSEAPMINPPPPKDMHLPGPLLLRLVTVKSPSGGIGTGVRRVGDDNEGGTQVPHQCIHITCGGKAHCFCMRMLLCSVPFAQKEIRDAAMQRHTILMVTTHTAAVVE